MCIEFFGFVVIIYVFEDDVWEEMLYLVDEISEYVLIGVVFSEDRYVLELGVRIFENVVGNFYINDKLIGVVVG